MYRVRLVLKASANLRSRKRICLSSHHDWAHHGIGISARQCERKPPTKSPQESLAIRRHQISNDPAVQSCHHDAENRSCHQKDGMERQEKGLFASFTVISLAPKCTHVGKATLSTANSILQKRLLTPSFSPFGRGRKRAR